MNLGTETYAEIQELLQALGNKLVFVGIALPVLGIIGFKTTAPQDDTHFQPMIEEQTVNVFLSTKDVLTNTLIIEMDATFTASDGINTYTYLILQHPIPQMDGWSRLPCNVIATEPTV
jgi:hypothetical protein